ncbi:mannose-1-phosphate guanylyltransferase/mannose-6-phosphate isomerase [Rhodanobacter sp. T12-5]|uniref:mannose-1-phosphate guanylyltransferase/mannose-6-phosphate isomerase n=1 Tax=Rhodanobacter sp. T12-5 TaxID=2024611 RepID=UPI0011EECE12|nr:mannose-1-phosphate guanylyltransferase/mannose-6-phosphate isomerase [Rhodanobacter sp. T12-5]KAA0072404.1 mannose-1-phosphate guanylyltransferase/mannose-6-phosphate isomerase [Rhodanobacter sp. T12-5]
MLIPVILSGGSGTRLWPLSRKNLPKQFLPLAGDSTLFQQTVARAQTLPGAVSPIVVCSEDHRFLVAEQLQMLGVSDASILLEPVARNTAPAIALAALQALSRDPDATLLVLPADHLIGDKDSFGDAVRKALPMAADGWLVTFGIRPDAPETGFGYIRRGNPLNDSGYQVDAFVEKPDRATAESYLNTGTYDWNSGMFLFQASRLLEELAQQAPSIHAGVAAAFEGAHTDLDFVRIDKEAFAKVPEDSIDYAVMERTRRAAVVPVSCEWSDIGSWAALWAASERDGNGNRLEGDVLALDSDNCFVRSTDRRMVALLGVHDLVVVDTPDAVLVAARDHAQDVKKLVDQLKAADRPEHMFHRKVYRPWGSYDSIDMGERFQVKRIVVKAGAALSLQKHHHRAEHWIVVSGTAEVTRNDEVFMLSENQSTYLPLGSVHRLRNVGKLPLELIEVQSGSYLGEDDIVRLEDVYGRA